VCVCECVCVERERELDKTKRDGGETAKGRRGAESRNDWTIAAIGLFAKALAVEGVAEVGHHLQPRPAVMTPTP